MSNFKWRGRREVLRLLALSLLVLAPLVMVAVRRKAGRAGAPSASASAAKGGAKTKIKIRSGPNLETVALSPDGTRLAGLVPGSLVVWDADTKREMARFPVHPEAATRLRWTGNTILTNSGHYAQSWDLTRGKTLSAPIDTQDSLHRSDSQAQETHIDPAGDLKTHTQYDGNFEMFRASTGQASPFKRPAGFRAVDFKLEEMSGSNWLVLKRSARGPVVLICAMPDNPPSPEPEATPTSTPAPLATPTPSAAMKNWQDKRTELLDELADLRNDLPEARTLPAPQREERTRRAMALQARIALEDARFQALASAAMAAAIGPAKIYYGRILAWDARTGQILWQRRLPVNVFMPVLLASPDARVVAALGTLRSSKTSQSHEFNGIDFLDGATGRTLSHSTLKDEPLREHRALWLPGHVLCMPDRDVMVGDILSFFDARNGRKRGSWPLQALALDQSNRYAAAPSVWSCDASGTQWVFATPSEGWRKLTTAQIEARVKAYHRKVAKQH